MLHAAGSLEAGDEDDAAYFTLSEVLDTLEQELRDAGFILAEQMGMTLLGVRLLDESPVEPSRLLAVARELHQHAQARLAGSRVRVHLCAHVGLVEARQGPAGVEITGGPLADTAGWVVRDASGFATTHEARRACTPEQTSPSLQSPGGESWPGLSRALTRRR